jgi:hypothetical protein
VNRYLARSSGSCSRRRARWRRRSRCSSPTTRRPDLPLRLCWGSATPIRPDGQGPLSINAYDCDAATLFGYDDAPNLRVIAGAGGVHAYDGALEHAVRPEAQGEGAIYDAPATTTAAEGAEAGMTTLYRTVAWRRPRGLARSASSRSADCCSRRGRFGTVTESHGWPRSSRCSTTSSQRLSAPALSTQSRNVGFSAK